MPPAKTPLTGVCPAANGLPVTSVKSPVAEIVKTDTVLLWLLSPKSKVLVSSRTKNVGAPLTEVAVPGNVSAPVLGSTLNVLIVLAAGLDAYRKLPLDVITRPEAPGNPSVIGNPAKGVNAPEAEE